MKRLLLIPLILAALGAAPSTQPATQPVWASQPWASKVVSNPDIEKIIAAFPKDLLPPLAPAKDDPATRNPKQRAWGNANAGGKTVTVTAFKYTDRGAYFYTPASDGNANRVFVILQDPKAIMWGLHIADETKVTIIGDICPNGGLVVNQDADGFETRFTFGIKPTSITLAP